MTILESVLQVVSEIIRSPDVRRVDKFDSGCFWAQDLMLAAGFVIEHERKPEYAQVAHARVMPYMMHELFVLPSTVAPETLLHLLQVLRSALRTMYDPAVKTHRLEARLPRLNHHQLSELLIAAFSRDSTTRREVEALLTTVQPPWVTLPDRAVSNIAVHLQGRAGLAWCATCRWFRSVQPAMRVLAINTRYNSCHYRGLPEQFAMLFESDARRGGVHQIIESISPRHAAEIKHLFVAPWLRSPNVPLVLYPERTIGAHLTAVRELRVTHPGRGWTKGHVPAFAQATCQLIRSVAPTLRTLDVRSCTQLQPTEIMDVIPVLGGISSLCLHLVPPGLDGPRGDPEDTLRLEACVEQVCTALEEPASIKCHRRGSRRYHERMYGEELPSDGSYSD